MSNKQPITVPLFSIGDLVKIRGFGAILLHNSIDMGIVTKGPYSYKSVESYHDMVYFEWWCYDVLVGNELITMMPENFLTKVKLHED